MSNFLKGFFVFSLLFLIFTTTVSAVTVTELFSENMYSWYNTTASTTGNTTEAGPYVIKPIGSSLYFGFNKSFPSRDEGKVVLAKHDGTSLTKIADIQEDALYRMKEIDGKLWIPGYDPNGGDDYDAGNMYSYDPSTSTLTKKRYRYTNWHYVDATTTDSNGNYTFSGLKPTSYKVKVIKPADTAFSSQHVAATGGVPRESFDSDFHTVSGETVTCDSSYSLGMFFDQEYTDDTIDAGLKSSSGASAGSATYGTTDSSFYNGDYTISGRVWSDGSNEGYQDSTETSGYSGVRVELYTKDPYFPCVIHMPAMWGSGSTIYATGGTRQPITVEIGGINYKTGGTGSAIFKSVDSGAEWEVVTEHEDRYFAYDLIKISNYYYRSLWSNEYSWDDNSYLHYLSGIDYSTDGINWTKIQSVGPQTRTDEFLSAFQDNFDIFRYDFSPTSELIEFRDKLYMPNGNGTSFYSYSGNTQATFNINGADFSGILPAVDDPDTGYSEVSSSEAGLLNNWNTFVKADGYILGIGSGNKLYASTNFEDWIEVHDFDTVDDGAPLGTISYWPYNSKIVAATVGQNGSVYTINLSDIEDLITNVSNSSGLGFYDDFNNSIDLKTSGGTGSITVQVQDGNYILAKVNSTFSGDTLDWDSVAGDVDVANGKSYITNLAEAPGTDNTFKLYVPIQSTEEEYAVRICPSATQLSDVNKTCTNGVQFVDNETKTVGGYYVTVTKETINGNEYWVADGIHTGGGINLYYADNLILNPGFEVDANSDNYPDDWWSRTQVSRDTSVKHSGNASMKIVGHSSWPYNYVFMTPYYPDLDAGTTYTMKAWVKTSGVTATGVQIRHALYVPAGNIYQTSWKNGTQDWVQISQTFTTHANTESGRFDINWHLLPGETVWVDDVRLCLGTGEDC